jgi:hypothetical protein
MPRQPRRARRYKPGQLTPYSGEGFNHWDDITPPIFDDEDTPRGQKPRLLAAKFKSSSPEAEHFIHDPLPTLVDGMTEGITSVIKERDELPPEPYIATMVINHHRTLASRIIRATAFIDDESVGITIHKEDDGS